MRYSKSRSVDQARPRSPGLSVDVFTRELAHELRTPIAQLQSIAELLLSDAARSRDTELATWLKVQIGVSQEMQLTVNGLLAMARDSLLPGARQPVDLHQVCVEFSQARLVEPRRAAIEWRIERPLVVDGSPSQLALLMRNLLSNAVKYTRDVASPVISVRVAHADDGQACIVVEDNGIGFTQVEAARLFRPFSRLEGQRFDGIGIGLTLAKRIVELHGGWIRASGRRGPGARFEFSLGPPRRQGQPAACPCARPRTG